MASKLIPAAVGGVLLLLAPAAPAATLHVAPDGAHGGACSRDAPCSVGWALSAGASQAGDTIRAAPGIYLDQPLAVERRLTITAAPDGPRPVFHSTAAGAAALSVTPAAHGTLVEHLTLQGTADTPVVELRGAAVLDELVVAAASGPCLRSDATGVRLEDSLFEQRAHANVPCVETRGSDTSWTGLTVRAPTAPTAAVYAGNGRITDATLTALGTALEAGGSPSLHRVTAVAQHRGIALTGSGLLTDSVAVARLGGSAVAVLEGTHQLLNVTAWGKRRGSRGITIAAGADVTVRNTIAHGAAVDVWADEPGRLVAANSIFRRARNVVDGGGNLHVAPRLVDPRSRNFRLRPRSPAVDAGSFEINAGGADRAGRFRWLGERPDIGAYEHAPRRPSRPRADRVAPRLSRVGLTATRFRAGRRGTAFAARSRGPGTILGFTLSEAADVVVTVARDEPRARVLGTIVKAFARGPGRTKLSGEIDGRLLSPGRYVLTVVARDTTQNLSRAHRLRFTVTRR